MDGVILRSGRDARNVLQAAKGIVHCVFANTLYLQSNTSLCCLGASELVAGPLNISTSLHRLEPFKPNIVKQGDAWQFEKQILTIADNFRFNASNSDLWQPLFPGLSADVQQLQKSLEKTLILVQKSTAPVTMQMQLSNSVTAQLVEKTLQSGILTLKHWIQHSIETPVAVPPELAKIIGCGDGLTPAGDDILCAALVTLHTLNINPAATLLADWTQQVAPALTNKISFSHLSSACQGQAVEPLHDFINQLLSSHPTNSQISSVTQQLIAYGASSGYYALQGVTLVLEAFLYQRKISHKNQKPH